MSRATFAYGRFNPPTEAGHGKLIKSVKDHAESTGGQHYIFVSHSQDAEKNPLRHAYKVAVMRKMFPGTNVSREIHPNVIGIMKHLEKQGHTHVTMVAGSDRVPEFHKLLHKYNGKEYNFKKIEVKSAGQRDPDAEGSEGMSASKLRGLVKAGKRREFISHYTNKKLGAEIHDKVKRAMNESRALFLLGGPGSGKDYVINNILTHFNLVEVQMDQILNGSVRDLIESGTNLMINAPVDMEKIALVRATLGEGYDTSFALVSVTNKVSRERNELRARPMNESVRVRKWLDAERSVDAYENVFKFDNSLNLSEASQRELTGFQMQIESFLKFMIENGYIFEKKFPPVAKDKETGLPKKYVAGLRPSTAAARKAHWERANKMSDSDPRAYEPAPGDATAKTKPSKHTLAVRKMMANEACWKGYAQKGMKKKGDKMVPNCVPVSESDSSLAAKAAKSGISVGTLRKVYKRGVAAWNSGHRPGTTPQQWGHARVNSYINKGKTYHTADKDLREGFTPDSEEIARHLMTKHKGNVKPKHLDAFQDELDTSKPIDREEIMSHVKKMKNAKQVQEVRQFRTPYGHSGGYNPRTGGKYKHPEQIEQDREERRKDKTDATDQYRNLPPRSKTDATDQYRNLPPRSKPVNPKDLVVPLSDTKPRKPRGSKTVGDMVRRDFPGVFKEATDKESKITQVKDILGEPAFTVTNRRLRRKKTFGDMKSAQAYADRGKKNEALEYGTTEARNAYAAMTPGQNVVDTTPTLKKNKPTNKKKTPGEDYDARMGGSGGYAVGLTQTFPESVSLEEAVQYHLNNQIPFAENIFRPGSDMFFELIREAKNLYANGEYTPADEYEQDMLESDLGETAMYEGMEVLLDFPFLEEETTPKHVRKLSKVEADEEEAVKTSIKKESTDYFRRRKREEDIISGKKPPRKKIPTRNDYAEYRAKMKEEACCDDCDDLNEEEGSSDPTKGKGIGKPWKEGGGGAVYVRTGDGGVKKVRFSQSGMAKRYRDPARLKSFMARHNCLGNKDKTSASYWACRYPRFFSNTGQLWW